MIQWIRKFQASSRQTKFFIFNWVIYGVLLLITTLYCYGRLDYVRSYKFKTTEHQSP
jgi:hypothetical protein